jgi:hypothetical protein
MAGHLLTIESAAASDAGAQHAVGCVDELPAAAGFGAPYPNPAGGLVQIPLALPEAAVPIEVIDLLGRRVALLQDGALDAGRHELAFETGGLAAGLHIVRAEVSGDGTPPRMLAHRLTVAR